MSVSVLLNALKSQTKQHVIDTVFEFINFTKHIKAKYKRT